MLPLHQGHTFVSCGSWNRTNDLLVQSQVPLPTVTIPHRSFSHDKRVLALVCGSIREHRAWPHTGGPRSSAYNDHMNDAPAEPEDRYAAPLPKQRVGIYWALLVCLPLATPFIAGAWFLLSFAGLGAVAVVFYLLTPLFVAACSVGVCRRVAGSSALLFAFLLASELLLILLAFLLGTPRWD